MGCYWDQTGTYQSVVEELDNLADDPLRTHRSFKKLRRANSVYYDLYNNGLCNQFSEVRTVLGVTPLNFGVTYLRLLACPQAFGEFYNAIEQSMDQIILAAADEAQLPIGELTAHKNIERALRWKKR
jgi:hypothetical protein